MMKPDVPLLEKMARKLRYRIVTTIGPNNSGHYGGSLSIADVVSVLYFYKMRLDPKNAKSKNRDRIVFSKGHAAVALYAALAERGFFDAEELSAFKDLGSNLQGHPDYRKTAGVDAGTGSLGQGLSIACGMAAAGKLDKLDYHVYCILGDGEMNEGQIWEAAQAAGVHRLDHLIGILDRNGMSGSDLIANRFNIAGWDQKWEAFGWNVVKTDGHNIPDIIRALDEATNARNGKPTLVIAATTKGKGLPIAENNPAFHNGTLTQEQYDEALAILEA